MGKNLEAKLSGHSHSCREKHGRAPDPHLEGRVLGCVTGFDAEGTLLRGRWTVTSTI